MLRWRLSLGALLIAALVGLCWLDSRAPLPGLVLLPLAVALAILASREVLDLAEAAGLRPVRAVVYLGNVLVVLSSWTTILSLVVKNGFANWIRGLPASAPWWLKTYWSWPLLALAFVTIAAFAAEIRRYEKPGRVMADLSAAMLAVVYVGLLMSVIVQIRVLCGIAGLASLLIVVKMGDTGAYAIGRLVGRTKLAAAISPGKTVEGAVGGLVFASIGAWATFGVFIVAPYNEVHAGVTPWWGWLSFGLAVGLAGMLGDLAESLLKRDAGVKDSGRWLPGFGGVLDLLDSVLMAAPVAYLFWALGWVAP